METGKRILLELVVNLPNVEFTDILRGQGVLEG